MPATSLSTISPVPAQPEEIEPLTATGFLRMTADITDNQTIYEVDKYFDALEKATETSLKAVMGLTIQCARCHDHKFDPILQKDYYKLTAAFQAVWDPETGSRPIFVLRRVAEPHVLDMEPDKSAGLDQGSQHERQQAIPTPATRHWPLAYDRYRQEIKAG